MPATVAATAAANQGTGMEAGENRRDTGNTENTEKNTGKEKRNKGGVYRRFSDSPYEISFSSLSASSVSLRFTWFLPGV
jgi:hypothetical protein